MSAWITLALGAKVSRLPVTRSSNRAPRLIIRSLRCSPATAATVPCIPGMPRCWGWLSGKAPRAISVVTTGMPVSSASCRSSRDAPARMTPPPTYSTGRLDSRMSRAASRICLLCGRVTGR